MIIKFSAKDDVNICKVGNAQEPATLQDIKDTIDLSAFLKFNPNYIKLGNIVYDVNLTSVDFSLGSSPRIGELTAKYNIMFNLEKTQDLLKKKDTEVLHENHCSDDCRCTDGCTR